MAKVKRTPKGPPRQERVNPDIDAYGNKKIRYATISQENQKCAKCLTSAAEICTQEKRLEEIEHELRRKE
jgi:hypothetical protein